MKKRYTLLFVLLLFVTLCQVDGFAAITLISPSNDTTFAAANDLRNVTFRWTKEPAGGMVQYIIQVDTTQRFSPPALQYPVQTIGDTTFQIPQQFPLPQTSGKYYWRVQSIYSLNQQPQKDSSAPFQFTIAGAAKEPPVVFYRISGGIQNVYSFVEDGPFVFTIGASDSVKISSLSVNIVLHRGHNLDPIVLPLSPLSQSVDFPGKLYGTYWYPPVSLLPGDTITYGFTGIDSLAFSTHLDSSAFKIFILSPDSASDYSRTLVPACQYVYELTDTNGRQVDSTRQPTRPDNEAAGLVHKYNTFCGPSAGASCFQWLGEGRVDSSFVDSLAEIFKTNVDPSDGSYPGNVANGAIKKLRGRYTVNLWQDTTHVFTSPVLDTGVTFHDAPPHLNNYSSELKDSEDVIISVGWWQDSAGVKLIRRGGHFLTGSGFRADGHFMTGAAVNDSGRFIEVMDPDCGRFRWIHWGGSGANSQGMDSIDYPGLSAGMVALVESMVSISKIKQGGTGVGEENNTPNDFFVMQNTPNPFSVSTQLVVQSRLFDQGMANYSLKVYDVLGREVADLTNALHSVNGGAMAAEFNGSALPAGIYYYKVVIGGFSQTKPMLMIK